MDDYVSFELAKKLNEKGFNKYSDRSYTKMGVFNHTETYKYTNEFYCYAPTIYQVLKWLREVKKIYCLPHIEPIIDKWFFYVMKPNKVDEFPEYMSESEWDSYEEAAIAGIEYILDNLI